MLLDLLTWSCYLTYMHDILAVLAPVVRRRAKPSVLVAFGGSFPEAHLALLAGRSTGWMQGIPGDAA